MNAEFNWWLLIVGLVVGAGLTWLVVGDTRDREPMRADAELSAGPEADADMPEGDESEELGPPA